MTRFIRRGNLNILSGFNVSCVVDEHVDSIIYLECFVDFSIEFRLRSSNIEVENRSGCIFEVLKSLTCSSGGSYCTVIACQDAVNELFAKARRGACHKLGELRHGC